MRLITFPATSRFRRPNAYYIKQIHHSSPGDDNAILLSADGLRIDPESTGFLPPPSGTLRTKRGSAYWVFGAATAPCATMGVEINRVASSFPVPSGVGIVRR